MNNKVDKLFKDKLGEHSIQPSAQAWEKVEAHLGKKNKMVVWRAVAALVLVGSVTFMMINWDREAPKETAESQESGDRSKESGERSQETGDRRQESGDRSKESGERSQEQGERSQGVAQQSNDQKSGIKKNNPIKRNAEVTSEQQVAVVDKTSEQLPVIGTDEPDTKTNEPVIASIPDTKPRIEKEKGITLTYTLPSIKKQEPVVAAVQEEPKKTGVQRVLEIAREVKNGDSPLAELREAKDDIFALDFRKDKNKKH